MKVFVLSFQGDEYLPDNVLAAYGSLAAATDAASEHSGGRTLQWRGDWERKLLGGATCSGQYTITVAELVA